MDQETSLKKISDYEPIIKKSVEKTIQALRIRAKLVDDKIDAINLLRTDKDINKRKEAIFRLKRCLKNEKNFIEIINSALKQQILNLEEIKKDFQNVKAESELIHSLDHLLEILKYAYEKIEDVKIRLEKEDNLLLNEENIKYDEEFMHLWKKEIEFDKKIVREMSTSKLSKIKKFCMRLKAIPQGTKNYAEHMYDYNPEIADRQKAIAMSYAGIVFEHIFEMLDELERIESTIFQKELQAIKKLDKRSGFFSFWN